MKKISSFIAGLLVGAMLFGGGAVYAASGVLAERSAQAVYVDGRRIELEAYLIDGANYVKLRDIGQAVNINVYWDGAVQIQTDAPYTGEAPLPVHTEAPVSVSETDYSAAANPAAFAGIYTREAYNAVYPVLRALRNGDDSVRGILHIENRGNQEERWAFEGNLIHLANGYTLSLEELGSGNYTVYAHDVYQSKTDPLTERYVAEWSLLRSDREKIMAVNDYLCTHLIFDASRTESVYHVVAASEALRGNCVTFAQCVNYFCGRLGIPCISVAGENHRWNAVYCDGSWSYLDCSANTQVINHAYTLFAADPPKQIADPGGTLFLKELLVPGSTK